MPAGEQVAIVGPSGAGKSTIARLLFRFYDPWSGRILIDGQDIAEVTQASLRAAIGIVPQDSVLFNDTIGYNIAYGRDDGRAAHDDIDAAAKGAAILPFIERLPAGLRHRGRRARAQAVGRREAARGDRPHAGQEPADPAARRGDQRARHAAPSRTSSPRSAAWANTAPAISIAHRLSTIADADRILVLDQGRLAESGTHAALLRRDGLYAEMWARQQAEQEDALA